MESIEAYRFIFAYIFCHLDDFLFYEVELWEGWRCTKRIWENFVYRFEMFEEGYVQLLVYHFPALEHRLIHDSSLPFIKCMIFECLLQSVKCFFLIRAESLLGYFLGKSCETLDHLAEFQFLYGF